MDDIVLNADEIKKGLEYISIKDVARKLDAWEDGIPYDFVEDAAADALALIQQLEATVSEKEKVVAELSGKIGQLEVERDAAVADLKMCVTEAAQGDYFDCCFACKYNNENGGCDRPNSTIESCVVEEFDNKWSWRGVQKEE